VFFCTGTSTLNAYLGDMFRSAPPAPFKMAFLTFAVAVAVVLALAVVPHPS
jgi:hypothetical protein